MGDYNSLVNYYPKYGHLDDVLTKTNKSELKIFVDLKGCMQSLFQEWAVRLICDQSKGARYVDNSIFSSFLEYISFHKVYAKKRGISLKMYVFFESGQSIYHSQLDPAYKQNRKGTSFLGLGADEEQLFLDVIDRNYFHSIYFKNESS